MSISESRATSHSRHHYYQRLLEECRRDIDATHCPAALRELEQLAAHLEYELHLS
jgi:hypothetical protein